MRARLPSYTHGVAEQFLRTKQPQMLIHTCALLFGHLLLFVPFASDISQASHISVSESASPMSIVILHTALLFQSANSGDSGGDLRVKWVLTSDAAAFSSSSANSESSLLVSCPEFLWDDVVLSNHDSYPSSHCGGMFGTNFPLSGVELAAGAHTLRLSLSAPSTLCDPSPCTDSVTVNIHPSSPASAAAFTIEDNLKPGGIPKIFHRIWLSPPSLPTLPIPSTYQRYWQSWKRLHQPQGWKFVTWTAANLARYVSSPVCCCLATTPFRSVSAPDKS